MTTDGKLEASCECGAVRVAVARRPDFINACNCSLCTKTKGVWAYYTGADVEIAGETSSFVRDDVAEPAVRIHSCTQCGTTTHWTLTEQYLARIGPADATGINMRLFEPSQLEGVEVRFPDGAGWDGKSDYAYRKPPIVLGRDESW